VVDHATVEGRKRHALRVDRLRAVQRGDVVLVAGQVLGRDDPGAVAADAIVDTRPITADSVANGEETERIGRVRDSARQTECHGRGREQRNAAFA
jgi:hypothetical protein